MKVNKFSLKLLLDLFFIMLTFVFFIYVINDLHNISKTLQEMQKEKVQLYLKNNNTTLATLLKFGFENELRDEIVKIVENSNDITGLKLILPHKKIEFIKRKGEKRLMLPLMYKNKKIATITVYYTANKIINLFFEKYLARFFLFLLITLPFVMLLFIYLRLKITKLNRLATNLKNINFRKTNFVEKIDKYYEIVNIINAVNKLLFQIHSFYSSQKNLLRKVIKLKKHLESAQKIAEIFSWEYDCHMKTFELTPRLKKFLGIKKDFLKPNEFSEYVNIEARSIFEHLDDYCNKCQEFEVIHKIITVTNKIYYFKTIGKCMKTKYRHSLVGVSLNITEEVLKQQKIEFLAYHDPLTLLPNRTYLKEQFALIKNISKREKKKFAVLYLDMDNFKIINDSLGHESGDELLIKVSKKLKSVIRKSDVIARIGGDEFVIILNDIQNKKSVEDVIRKLISILNEPIKIKNSDIIPTFSIGCAIYPDDSEDTEELLKFADIAMYEAKNNGKNSFAFISENLKSKTEEFYRITNELQDALNKEELVLYFQPKIDIVNGNVYGAEGLIRWRHPKKGIMTPFSFIPYAEKSGLINLIDRYVLEKAFATLLEWSKIEKMKNLNLAVNISANEFRQKDFVLNLKKLLEKYRIDPSKLEIEITETLSMQDINYTVTVLEEIKSLGFKIALDDFGTGYSSLNYLKKIPFDTLKIDQSFVKDLATDHDDLIITKMIIQIAGVLNKRIVAEGVENETLLKIVKKLGCELVQGYYFAKPLSENDLKMFINEFNFKLISD